TRRAPKRDAREIAEMHVHGQEAIATIRFELIGESGQLVSVAAAVRTSSGVDDGDYYLRVPVPGQPFRFRINGRDVAGKPFSRLDRKLFRPGEEAAPVLASAGPSFDAMFQAALRQDAEGWLRIPRTEVAEAGYELLTAPSGHPIGLRLHFA